MNCFSPSLWRALAGLASASLPPVIQVAAQPPALLTTAATVARNQTGQDVAWIAWEANTAGVLRGRLYALYAKAGPPTAASPFTRRAILPVLPTAASLAPLLAQAGGLGLEVDSIRESLTAMGAPAGVPLPDQLAALLTAAQDKPRLLEMLVLLGKAYPVVELALGRAWTGPIPAGETTFELREFDPQAQTDIATVARVSVTAGAFVPLPPPGPPVQVPDSSPAGDLLVRLRWATPVDLRHRSALVQGYNVWRLPLAEAEQLRWVITPPTLTELARRAQRANPVPVIVQRDFDASSVADFNSPDTQFVDDNGRFTDPARAFTDGAEFAYFVTARDLLGRDGLPSLAGTGRACHTMPPRIPAGLKAANAHSFGGQPGAADHQWFQVTWSANTQTSPDQTTHYELFRGIDLRDLDTPDGPPPANLIATVPHAPGQSIITYDDRSLTPEANYFGKTFWFAIRARRDGPCGPIHSAMSPPVFANLKRYSGPPAPTGVVNGNCPFPVVAWQENRVIENTTALDGVAHFTVQCHRRGPGIIWAEFTVGLSAENRELQLGRIFFPDELNEVSVDYTLTAPQNNSRIELWCRVGSAEGLASTTAVRPAGRQLPSGNGGTVVDIFEAAELTTWDVRPDEPLAAGYLVGQVQCFQAAYADPAGIVALQAQPFAGKQFALFARTSGGIAASPDRPIGTFRVQDGMLTFPDPFLVGTSPADVKWVYCGYELSPDLVFGECAHLARPDGGDRVHDLQVLIRLHPDAREFRLFRQIDGGDLELIAQGAADGSLLPSIPVLDPALPPRPARLCYYAQLLDENGLASPMALLGCRQTTASLPVPLLGAPQSEGDRLSPKARLHWFCPTSGVERFEVFLRPVAGSNTPSTFAVALAKLPTSAFNAEATHLVRDLETQAYIKLNAGESFVTGRIGGDLPGGPEFELSSPVEAGIAYDIWMKAVGPTGRRGQPSAAQRFTWRPPAPPRDRAPWPARPLPPKLPFNPRIAATTKIDCPLDRDAYPVGVRIGAMPLLNGRQCASEANSAIVLMSAARAIDLSAANPNRWLFRDELSFPLRTNITVLPAVLYRQQATNLNFPVVSGDVVQVSPLVEKLAWGSIDVTRDTHAAVLLDPFIGVKEQSNQGSVVLGPGALELILLDTHPVLSGARYRYWLLHFDADGEPDGVIPAGEVDIP